MADARPDRSPSFALASPADPWFLELDAQGSVFQRGGPVADTLATSLGGDGATQVKALALRVISSQASAQLEFRHVSDGAVESWRAEAAPWGDAAAPRALMVLRNVTAQREGAHELLRMGSFPVLDPSPTLEVDLDGAVRFANPAARRVFPDLLELGARHPIAMAAVNAHRSCEGGGPAQLEYAHGDRHFELSVSRIDELRSLRVFTIDVTERKKMEATLVRTDRLVSLGTICAGVGHEINNPLAYVLANLEFMTDEVARLNGGAGAAGDLTGLVETLDDTRKGVERIATIVGDLKALSRGTAQQAVPVDVRAILESTLRMAASQLRGHATVVREFADVPTVDADETRLGQVFLNLVVNAIHAMKHAGGPAHRLTLATRADSARQVLVEIKDTGGGIPAHVAARLFEPFFTTKAVGVGTGLGLSISRSIISGFGGSLAFETEPGRGTTFRVTLPPSGCGAPSTS